MKQTIRTMSALLTIIALAVFVCSFTACTDDENDNNDITPILRPIAEHITGIWKMDKSYALENGEWVEDPIPEGYVEDIILRSDGTYILSIQNNNGGFDSMTKSYATMNKRTWSIDEVTNVLTLGELKRPVERLNDKSWYFLPTAPPTMKRAKRWKANSSGHTLASTNCAKPVTHRCWANGAS